MQGDPAQASPLEQSPELVGVPLGMNRDAQLVRDDILAALVPVKAAALAPPRPVPLASGSGLGRPARRSGPGRLTPIRRSKRLIAVVIGREVQTSTFILPG